MGEKNETGSGLVEEGCWQEFFFLCTVESSM